MIKLIMPKMGESVAEATILKWLKKEGDAVEADEPVLEIATDKVDSEVPSPAAGTLTKRFFEEGQVVKVGEVIGHISAVNEEPSSPEPVRPAAVSSNGSHKPAEKEVNETVVQRSSSGRFYSPLVRNIARQSGLTMEDLEKISGTGANNRLTKHDLLKHLEQRS